MGSVNKVILIGRLGADVELKYTPSGKAVCNMSLATSEQWKDKSGAKQEKTEWHKVVAWNDTAENCQKYLAKGREVYVEGRLTTESYEKDGSKRYVTKVIADRVVFLSGGGTGGTRDNYAGQDGKRGGGGGFGGGGGSEPAPTGAPGAPIDDSDIF